MSDPSIRSHAPHRSIQETPSQADLLGEDLPSQCLHSDSDEVQSMLEELDDVIFDAVRGDTSALQRAHVLWPKVIAEIGWELVEESREQYLRYAVDVIRRFEPSSSAKSERGITAIEIISLLTKDY